MFQNEKNKKQKQKVEPPRNRLKTRLWLVSFEIDKNARWDNPQFGTSAILVMREH